MSYEKDKAESERVLRALDQALDMVHLHLTREDYKYIRGVLGIRALEARQGSRIPRSQMDNSVRNSFRRELAKEADKLVQILDNMESQV